MQDTAIELEALRVFKTVVDLGSFSAAGKQLGRAQSAVSYVIKGLEDGLGVELFDRSGYRPRLTEAGQTLLPRVERLLLDASVLSAAAVSLAGGVEAEITVVVEPFFPMEQLVRPLGLFAQRFPLVRLRLIVEALGAAVDAVHDGAADLGILVALADRFEGLDPYSLIEVELVPVAAPSHPLALIQSERCEMIPNDAAREHLQLVLTDRSDRTAGVDKGVQANMTWRLSNLESKRLLLLSGVGWGSLPRGMVEADLEKGALVELRLAGWDGYDAPPRFRTSVVHRRDRALGPAAQWLHNLLTELQDPQSTAA